LVVAGGRGVPTARGAAGPERGAVHALGVSGRADAGALLAATHVLRALHPVAPGAVGAARAAGGSAHAFGIAGRANASATISVACLVLACGRVTPRALVTAGSNVEAVHALGLAGRACARAFALHAGLVGANLGPSPFALVVAGLGRRAVGAAGVTRLALTNARRWLATASRVGTLELGAPVAILVARAPAGVGRAFGGARGALAGARQALAAAQEIAGLFDLEFAFGVADLQHVQRALLGAHVARGHALALAANALANFHLLPGTVFARKSGALGAALAIAGLALSAAGARLANEGARLGLTPLPVAVAQHALAVVVALGAARFAAHVGASSVPARASVACAWAHRLHAANAQVAVAGLAPRAVRVAAADRAARVARTMCAFRAGIAASDGGRDARASADGFEAARALPTFVIGRAAAAAGTEQAIVARRALSTARAFPLNLAVF